MTCQQAREILVDGFPSAVAGRERIAHEHVRACKSCQSYLREQTQLTQRLRELSPEKPSSDFKERVFTEISRLRWQWSERRRKSKIRWVACLAAAALGLVLVARFWFPSEQASPLVEYLVEDHQQNLPGRFMLTSSSPEEIERWFEGKLDFSYHAKVPQGMELLGARLCRVEDARAALVFYRCRSHTISWFTFPETPATLKLVRKPATFARGYNLMLWRKDGLVHAVISDMDSNELRSMLQPLN